MIKMTDKELVEYLCEIIDGYVDCSVEYYTEEGVNDDMFYILNRVFCVVLNEDGIWEKDDSCKIADSFYYWKQLVEDTIKEKIREKIGE